MNMFQRLTRGSKITLVVAVVAALAVSAMALRGRQNAADAAAPARTAGPVAEFLQDDLFIVEPRNLERTLPLTGSLAPLNRRVKPRSRASWSPSRCARVRA
jgi:hypothetical protein